MVLVIFTRLAMIFREYYLIKPFQIRKYFLKTLLIDQNQNLKPALLLARWSSILHISILLRVLFPHFCSVKILISKPTVLAHALYPLRLMLSKILQSILRIRDSLQVCYLTQLSPLQPIPKRVQVEAIKIIMETQLEIAQEQDIVRALVWSAIRWICRSNLRTRFFQLAIFPQVRFKFTYIQILI